MKFDTLDLNIYFLEPQLMLNTLRMYEISYLDHGYVIVRPTVLIYLLLSINIIFHSFQIEHTVVYLLDFASDIFVLFLCMNFYTLGIANRMLDL